MMQSKAPGLKRYLNWNNGKPTGAKYAQLETRKQNLAPPTRHENACFNSGTLLRTSKFTHFQNISFWINDGISYKIDSFFRFFQQFLKKIFKKLKCFFFLFQKKSIENLKNSQDLAWFGIQKTKSGEDKFGAITSGSKFPLVLVHITLALPPGSRSRHGPFFRRLINTV